MKSYLLAVLAYLVPTFLLGYFWHLSWFDQVYHALAMYRNEVIIPFGLGSMLIQAIIFAWIFDRAFQNMSLSFWRKAAYYGVLGAALSWSFTTLAVAAKNVMTSVPQYLEIETAFTVVQWAFVAPLTVWTLSRR
jgi:hypothetical protein